MINSIKLSSLLVLLSFVSTIFHGFFEAKAEIQKYFSFSFLVQMKTLEFAFKINWPLLYAMGQQLNACLFVHITTYILLKLKHLVSCS